MKINTKIELFVSDDLELIDDNCIKQLDYNDITTIIGVITDNMIDAVKEQDNKLVSICFYIEDGLIHMQFANSIKESVDLSEIFKSGFSTKGPNRGVGLSLVKNIIEHNKYLDCKPRVVDNFFVQDFTINYQKS